MNSNFDLKFLLLLTAAFLTGNWLLDVGHVVFFVGGKSLTNGLWTVPALTAYHLSWYFSIFCFFVLAFMYLDLRQKFLEVC